MRRDELDLGLGACRLDQGPGEGLVADLGREVVLRLGPVPDAGAEPGGVRQQVGVEPVALERPVAQEDAGVPGDDGAPGDPTTGEDTVVCVVNVDGLAVREATIHLDLGALGLDEHAPYDVVDELTGEVFTWRGSANYVRLDPAERVGHVLHVVAG